MNRMIVIIYVAIHDLADSVVESFLRESCIVTLLIFLALRFIQAKKIRQSSSLLKCGRMMRL